MSFLEFVATYLDDIRIFSNSIEKRFMHLRFVLEHLLQFKLYAKPSKCEYGRHEKHTLILRRTELTQNSDR